MLLVAPSIGTGTLSPVGTVAPIISSVSWDLGSLYSSRAQLPVSILASPAMLMNTGGLMLTAISLLLGEYRSFELSQISAQSLSALIYLTAIITIVGFTDFYWLIRVTTPSLANTFAYVSPVIAVIRMGASSRGNNNTYYSSNVCNPCWSGNDGNNTRQRQEEHIVRRHKI
jgi:drug/metabolite transporter (DMT)-like permease